jgi:hypothetical protein
LAELVDNGYDKFVDEPDQCSHILCNKLSVTTKILGAIVYRKPIVTSEWFFRLVDIKRKYHGVSAQQQSVINSTAEWPSERIYFPPVTDGFPLHLENIRASRASILKGLTVILFARKDVFISI